MDAKTQLAELREILKGHENRIHCVHTTMTNNVFYERALSFRRDRMEILLNEITRLKHERHNGAEIIAQEQDACTDLRRRIKTVQHQAKIDELKALETAMRELSVQVDNASIIAAAGMEILDDEEQLDGGGADECI
jgi:tRNA A37 threonylcarbamoyltransferase TsaD